MEQPNANDTTHASQTVTLEQALVSRVSKKELVRWTEENALPYRELMAYCRCAMREIETKVQHCGETLLLQTGEDPIESIRTALKSPESIVDTVLSEGFPLMAESIEQNIHDLARVLVICPFPSDIYALAEALIQEPSITLLRKDNFMESPGESGYRGLHLVVSTVVTLQNKSRGMKVAVALRTGAMELWVNAERQLIQSAGHFLPTQVEQELRECAALSAEWDQRMEQIRYNLKHNVITK